MAEIKQQKKAKPDEDPKVRFRRLGVARTKRALKAINAIAKLSGKGYDYTPEQANAILGALSKAFTACEQSLKRVRVVGDPEFTL